MAKQFYGTMGRLKKYKTEAERLAARRKTMRLASLRAPSRLGGRFWRLVIPAIEGYGVRPPRDCQRLARLKREVTDLILDRQRPRGLEHWCVAWQTHSGSGLPHLDILLGYHRAVKNSLKRYDYVLKHGDLTRYKALNRAILDYGRKQDPCPLSNIDSDRLLLESEVKGDLYGALQAAMVRNPEGFNAADWLDKHDLFRAASRGNYAKALKMVRDRQASICHRKLRNKPGFGLISPEKVRQRLSRQEYKTYQSWSGYATIVDFLNQIPRWGLRRPHKTPNLLIVGRPNIGKTTLGRRLSELVASYPLGVRSWFPSYRDGVYRLMRWEEFTLSKYPYDLLLRLLEGEAMQLPIKGGHVRRRDNQLIIMTSNLTLEEHIRNRFREASARAHARLNLPARVTQVVVPPGHDLFLLVNLLA